jgi:hypothetical protein
VDKNLHNINLENNSNNGKNWRLKLKDMFKYVKTTLRRQSAITFLHQLYFKMLFEEQISNVYQENKLTQTPINSLQIELQPKNSDLDLCTFQDYWVRSATALWAIWVDFLLTIAH